MGTWKRTGVGGNSLCEGLVFDCSTCLVTNRGLPALRWVGLLSCRQRGIFLPQVASAFPNLAVSKTEARAVCCWAGSFIPFQANAFTSTKSETAQLYSPNACPLQLGSNSFFWGLALIITGSGSFIAFLYAAILSKVLQPSGIPILSAIENDRYYCLLVPLTLPILVVLVYFHWLGMKLFKHA